MTAKKKSEKETARRVETNSMFDHQKIQEREMDSLTDSDETLSDEEEKSLSEEVLYERLKKAENEKQETYDRLLRTMAEFENYKKRVAKEKVGLITYGTEKLAFELLPVVDNFERAFEQAKNAKEVQPVVEGIEMILKQFVEVLEKFNIKAFNSVGEPFDPEKHEAMAQQEHHEHKENTVIDEFQRGYFLDNRLLRPARVIVSKSSSNKVEKDSEPDEEKENDD